MDRKQSAILATIVTAVLCGCPGLFGLFMGSLFTLIGNIPGAQVDINGSNDPERAVALGLTMLCVSVFLIAIPVVVGWISLRRRPGAPITIAPPAVPPPPDEPLPPAI